MKKLRLTIELEYDDTVWHGGTAADIAWFREYILGPQASLVLHENDLVGDSVGDVTVVKIHEPNHLRVVSS